MTSYPCRATGPPAGPRTCSSQKSVSRSGRSSIADPPEPCSPPVWRHDCERHGDIADLLVCRCEERLGVWPVDLSGGSGLPAAGGGYPARQLVVDRQDRGDLEMRPGYRDEGFPVCGFNSPGQLSRVFGRVPDRNAYFDRAIAVGGDDAVEDDETFARYAAAPRGGCGEPGRGFPDPGQLTGVDVPLLGQHRLLRDVPLPDWQVRRGHPRHGDARPEAGHHLPLGGEPPFRRAPVRVDEP